MCGSGINEGMDFSGWDKVGGENDYEGIQIVKSGWIE